MELFVIISAGFTLGWLTRSTWFARVSDGGQAYLRTPWLNVVVHGLLPFMAGVLAMGDAGNAEPLADQRLHLVSGYAWGLGLLPVLVLVLVPFELLHAGWQVIQGRSPLVTCASR